MSHQMYAELTGAVIVRPGEILVLTTDQRDLTAEQAHDFRDRVMEELPGLDDVKIIIGFSGVAVYRDDETAGFPTRKGASA